MVKIFQINYFCVGQSIIFHVTCSQTQDKIDRIKYNKSAAKIIGVDIEQSKIYG
ncbi:hypothetical protein [Spiroplasma endosymbiont of Polydrusus formosus]|uniref:hypothetical protein n=1 Tax=Spiroplasma endosymbiont of Polydrusus formosus TaxID=3139326 RepID=UPI0035B50135